MKIVFAAGIFPPDIGGPAGYVPRLAEALSHKGHSVVVVAASDEAVDNRDSLLSYRVVRAPRTAGILKRSARLVGVFVRELRDANLLYVNGLAEPASLAGLLSGVPQVHKIVGDYAWERARNKGWYNRTLDEFQLERGDRRLRMLRSLRNAPLRAARHVIVPSRYLASIVQGWGIPSGRVHVVFNAVESTQAPLQRPIGTAGSLRIFSAARLVNWKGIDGLLNAVASLPGVHLEVAGEGPERSNLMALSSALGLERRVRFTGALGPEGMAAAWTRADAFVLNSTYEGLPHVVLEAMVNGVPVVATSVGGTPELVHDEQSGLLVAPGDVEALKKSLARLRDQPALREKLRLGGLRLIDGPFNEARMVSQTIELLESAAR